MARHNNLHTSLAVKGLTAKDCLAQRHVLCWNLFFSYITEKITCQNTPAHKNEQNEVQVESLFLVNFIIWLLSFTEEKTADTGRFSWPHAAVLLLLSTFQDHRHLFMRPTMKRVEVWKKISKAMVIHGIVFSHSNCEKKWNNLKAR